MSTSRVGVAQFMNDRNNWWNKWKEIGLEYLDLVIRTILDGLFLVIWVIAQYYAGEAVEQLALSDIDQVVLVAFQIVFALSTLVPVALYVVRDVARAYLRAIRSIRDEIDKNGRDGEGE